MARQLQVFWDESRQLRFQIDPTTGNRVYERSPRNTTSQPLVSSGSQRIGRAYSEGSSNDEYTHRPSTPSNTLGTYDWSIEPQPLNFLNHELFGQLRDLTFYPDALQYLRQQQQWQGQQSNSEVFARSGPANGAEVVTAVDTSNGVQTAYVASTPDQEGTDQITDPVLAGAGVRARRLLLPTTGEAESLDPSYRIRPRSPNFFVVGRVFHILWVEPAGENNTNITYEHTTLRATSGNDDPGYLPGRFGQQVYSKVRRFVVIREGHQYCSALPIMSYGQRGVGKPGVKKSEHVIIFTGTVAPRQLASEKPGRREEGMRSTPIRVVPDIQTGTLDEFSRLDLGKVYTIHHNVKVKPLGMVHERSRGPLLAQFSNVFAGTTDLLQFATIPSSGFAGGAAEGDNEEDEDAGEYGDGDEDGPEDEEAQERAARLADHNAAFRTDAMFRRLRDSGRTHGEAMAIMVSTLIRHQTNLSPELAEQMIRQRRHYMARQRGEDGPSEGDDDEQDDDEDDEDEDEDEE